MFRYVFFLIMVGSMCALVSADNFSEVQNRVVKVQATSTLPVSITGMDKKGYVGEILSRIFDPLGKIRNEFVLAFQSLAGSSNQNLKWDGNKFVYGSISNSGSYVGIGDTTPSYTLDVNGNINFNGDLYHNGNLFSGGKFTDGIDARDAVYEGIGKRNVGIGTSAPTQKLQVEGNILTKGDILFGTGTQRISGNDSSAFYIDSNHSSETQLIFRDMEDTVFGRVAGSSDGADFGLIDADGNWTYKAVKDQYTDFRVNNTSIMTLSGGSIIAQGANAFRMRQSRYSVIHRNDNANYWLLFTDSGSTDASYNSLRPLKIDLANGNINLDGATFSVDATNNYIGIGVNRPTDELDVNGKIRMRVQTQVTDTPDTVATKKYVDDKIVREEDKLKGYTEVALNLDEDIYGAASNTGVYRPRGDDTCNGNSSVLYSCSKNDNKSCRDEYTYTTTRRGSDGDEYITTWYTSRPIICIKALTLVRTEGGAQGMKVSNSGTATIISRDYSGWREYCGVSINIPAVDGNPSCVESHSFRLASGFGGGGNDGSCEAALEAAIKSEGICKNYKGVQNVNWNRSGDSGTVKIEYFGF